MSTYFFCGIGGSGMLPLALILMGQGHRVSGSDRSYDQGRTPDKFAWIKSQGICLFPQTGEGLTAAQDALVVSSAIEDGIPEVKKAKELGVPIIKRAELLAQIFDKADRRIAVGGTSGKSTTTGMLAWILHSAGKKPTVMNGASFLNFAQPDNPYTSALVGSKDMFVSECDESDGSIILYHPATAILHNIALDHKPVAELIPIFRQYLAQSQRQVLNVGNEIVRETFADEFQAMAFTYGLDQSGADLNAHNYQPSQTGSSCEVIERKTGQSFSLRLAIPGRHNVENALAAIAAATLEGVPVAESVAALSGFLGVGRRLENVGKVNNISVIDDFAHNPDKISTVLNSLNEHSGRLIVIFQMHGYGPLKLMKDELAAAFCQGLKANDQLIMPDVLYMGGTADKSYTADDFIKEINSRGAASGVRGEWIPTREAIITRLKDMARSGDRIIVMGARDDTLPLFARDILESLK